MNILPVHVVFAFTVFHNSEVVMNLFKSGIKLLAKSVPAYCLLKTSFSISYRANKMEKIIAIAQMCSTNDKAANRLQVQEIIENAVKQNACVSTFSKKNIYIKYEHKLLINFFQFVFLPECCDYVGSNREETISLAEPLNGRTVSFYKQLAKKNNVWLSLGGIHERTNIEVNNFQYSN